MCKKNKVGIQFFLQSINDVFCFFFDLGKRAKKTRIFYLISFLPVMMALLIKFLQPFYSNRNIEDPYIFSNMIMVFYLQFLILILSLFFGTSVCSEEIEGKTLIYLITRPISKASIIIGKYGAYMVLVILMTVIGVFLSFMILNINNLLDFSIYKVLLRDVSVLILGIICYSAFFTFIGTFIKRSILFGLIFSFGWENVIQYFPGSTQRFTIAHYLKSLLPSASSTRFSFLLFRLEPTSPRVAVLILIILTAIFLAIACLLFTVKDYILED